MEVRFSAGIGGIATFAATSGTTVLSLKIGMTSRGGRELPNSSNFQMYGENAATFLIFQGLAITSGAIEKVLLKNLKNFGSGAKRIGRPVTESEIWLFPNFGKGGGFGEPDAIVIADEDVFWFEVETSINCRRSMPSLRKSLLQMWRFRLLQAALARGPKFDGGAKRIIGQTIGDDGRSRRASVKLSGHGVLKKLMRRLREAGTNNRDHYVLFSVNKPIGPGMPGTYSATLRTEAEGLESDCTELERLPIDRCWYAYWKDDLESKFAKHSGCSLLFDEQYVRIKKR